MEARHAQPHAAAGTRRRGPAAPRGAPGGSRPAPAGARPPSPASAWPARCGPRSPACAPSPRAAPSRAQRRADEHDGPLRGRGLAQGVAREANAEDPPGGRGHVHVEGAVLVAGRLRRVLQAVPARLWTSILASSTGSPRNSRSLPWTSGRSPNETTLGDTRASIFVRGGVAGARRAGREGGQAAYPGGSRRAGRRAGCPGTKSCWRRGGR